MFTFEKLENRYHLTGVLEFKQAVHIGSGESEDEIDSLFVCDHNKRHYIPGSSLRGALRSTIERIVAAIDPAWSCGLDPESSTPCPSGNQGRQKALEKKISEGKTSESAICKELEKDLCPTCKTFGCPFLSSRVRLADLYPLNNAKPKGNKRFGVAIDRDTETVAKGLLFTYQVLEAGEKFDFELWAENMTDSNWGVLAIGLLELLAGNFWVGGKKSSSGLGQCLLVEKDLKLEYFDGAEDLKKHLSQTPWPNRKSGPDVKKFLQSKVETLFNPTP